jgi:general stress protein 26
MRKLAELIRGMKVAMLTTLADDNTLRSRPMASLDVEFDGRLWFFTAASSDKVADVAHERQLNVSYADADLSRYVSLSGAGRLVDDPRRIRALWRPEQKAWFPRGLSDPDLALLCVDVVLAEYWDGSTSETIRFDRSDYARQP